MRFAVILLAICLPATAAESVQLFNGKDLTGWTMVGPGRFTVENGLLRTEGGMGLLYYPGQQFGWQTIHVVFKTASQNANSGVYIRMPEKPADPWYGVHNGYEVQIDAGGDEWHSTGALYSLSKVSKRAQKPNGEWNTMDIQLDGQTTRVYLNGEKVNDFTGDQSVPDRKQWFEPVRGKRPDQGYIGLQNHDANSIVYFREVSVQPLEGAKSLSKSDRDHLLSYLHATRKQVIDAAAGLTPEQLNYKPAADRWSVAQVLEHLTLAEGNIRETMLAGLHGNTPAPAKRLTDEAFTAMIRDRSQKREAPPAIRPAAHWLPEDLSAEFARRRNETLDWVRETRADLRGRFVNFSGGAIDVYQGLLLIPAHNERHLQQINEVMASPGFPKAAGPQ